MYIRIVKETESNKTEIEKSSKKLKTRPFRLVNKWYIRIVTETKPKREMKKNLEKTQIETFQVVEKSVY